MGYFVPRTFLPASDLPRIGRYTVICLIDSQNIAQKAVFDALCFHHSVKATLFTNNHGPGIVWQVCSFTSMMVYPMLPNAISRDH